MRILLIFLLTAGCVHKQHVWRPFLPNDCVNGQAYLRCMDCKERKHIKTNYCEKIEAYLKEMNNEYRQ